jgi:hypothetical protein
MKTSNRKQIIILSFTLIVVMLGFGMVIPIFPFYGHAGVWNGHPDFPLLH